MAYNNRCPDCGAYLDHGEKCDCREEVKNDVNTKDIACNDAHIGRMVHM